MTSVCRCTLCAKIFVPARVQRNLEIGPSENRLLRPLKSFSSSQLSFLTVFNHFHAYTTPEIKLFYATSVGHNTELCCVRLPSFNARKKEVIDTTHKEVCKQHYTLSSVTPSGQCKYRTGPFFDFYMLSPAFYRLKSSSCILHGHSL